MVLPFAVEFHQNADNTFVRHVLDAIGVITADKIFLILDAKHSMKNVFAVAARVQSYVAALQRLIRFSDVDDIAVRAEQGPHTESPGM